MKPLMRGCDCDCGGSGHKAIIARKVWHGAFPYDAECDSADQPTTCRVKYLRKGISAVVKSDFSYQDQDWSTLDPLTAEKITRDCSASYQKERAATNTVDRNSGVMHLSDCVELLKEDGSAHSSNAALSPAPTCSVQVTEVLCGAPSYIRVEWVDILSKLRACSGLIYSDAAACAVALAFPGGRTPEQIVSDYEGLSYSDTSTRHEYCADGGDLYSSSTNTLTVTATCSLSGTEIELHVTYHQKFRSDSWKSIPGTEDSNPYGHYNQVVCALPIWTETETITTMDALIQLSLPYTDTQLNEDAEALLNLRDLTDDTHYAWHHGCSYPYITRDEVETPASPHDFVHGDCTWADVNATTGGRLGSGFTGDIVNGSGAVTQWISPSFDYWDGAFKKYYLGWLTVGKYAEMLATRAAHNWFRPCGAGDRAISGESIGGCPATLYPDAWPICGRIAVVSTTGNGVSPIVVEVASIQGLQTGDHVDISGVLGNTAANVTDAAITVVDSTHFSLDTTTGNGAYVSGGFAISHGAPSYTWNDATPQGDYFLTQYAFNRREIGQDPSIRAGMATAYGLDPAISAVTIVAGNIASGSPRVVSISPSGDETWAHGDAYAFDAAAMPLVCDERWGSDWVCQVTQRMLDPIAHTAYVEARASVPAGAPALPVLGAGCCSVVSVPYCPFVEFHSIAELTTMLASCVGTPPVCPVPTKLIPWFSYGCQPFDDDV